MEHRRRSRFRRISITLVGVFLIATYGVLVARVDPLLTPEVYEVVVERQKIELPWPANGTASLGYIGNEKPVENSQGTQQVPSASTIKLLTALTVLNRKPLASGDPGEMITFTDDDVARTEEIRAGDGTVALIPANTAITYRQALEALLMASANNVAEKLAVWAYGDFETYKLAAEEYARSIGLQATKVADASGLSPESMTTANDLVRLAASAYAQPVVRSIVSQAEAEFINGTKITNTNAMLANGEVNGMKTGYTDEAGACLVLSMPLTVGDKEFVLISAVTGQPDRSAVYETSRQLLEKFADGFHQVTILPRRQEVGLYRTPWGDEVPVRVRDMVIAEFYRGQPLKAEIDAWPTRQASEGTQVGILSAGDSRVELELAADIPPPPLEYRLTHAFDFLGEK